VKVGRYGLRHVHYHCGWLLNSKKKPILVSLATGDYDNKKIERYAKWLREAERAMKVSLDCTYANMYRASCARIADVDWGATGTVQRRFVRLG